MENIGWGLIVVSAIFQGLALNALGNTKYDKTVRKKRYFMFLAICMVFFIPGAIVLISTKF